ncbi:serine-tRNA ligase [Cryptococcus bacillisporus CA1280]|uniref:serine--tRNA ligase n=2 Tax=Cryptococcus gattii TaxID=552467 RepID=A0A0D0UFY6_CRYGA|nr:serine-tRNA ligase [Cryptococcus bacillisporus CA1280]KIR60362.1 serine-tRNA ligase [Cryptococcus bacillisporus CA1873]|eukprot:KIR60362.1 serine-tRNA ligase [Cryptococcus gattii CA1873]
MIDLIHLQADKGGNPDIVRESQKKRGASVELVDEVIAIFAEHKNANYEMENAKRELNLLQKEIGQIKKAKGDATELLAKKADMDKKIAEMTTRVADLIKKRDQKAGQIGNIVDSQNHVSLSEDDNPVLRLWHPEPNHKGNSQLLDESDKPEGIISHHEVLARLEAYDTDRGVKVFGHRGFYLTNDGVDLNQALINYGLDFLRKKGFRKVQPPFMIKKEIMGATAQLEDFDEALYKVSGGAEDMYLIATSEQPISAYHMDENLDPKNLPLHYAGYSTCFRKEAGSHGRDTWGIFRVHQFEKVEQFIVCEPEASPAELDNMVANAREFYESLGIPYRLVNIVSGGLNNAAAIKYDLEAWFPYQGEYKELVSCSNCTDYQSRSLNVRLGFKEKDKKTGFVHMLNGTLCATERALCCLVENYQTPEGLRIPEVLQPYMQGRDFLPYTAELPKTSTSKGPSTKGKK